MRSLFFNSNYHYLQTNTFQGVVITDGSTSFAVFIYRCGSIGWSGDAVIGFKAIGGFFKNHPLSGAVADCIACTGSPALFNTVIYKLTKEGIKCMIHSEGVQCFLMK